LHLSFLLLQNFTKKATQDAPCAPYFLPF